MALLDRQLVQNIEGRPEQAIRYQLPVGRLPILAIKQLDHEGTGAGGPLPGIGRSSSRRAGRLCATDHIPSYIRNVLPAAVKSNRLDQYGGSMNKELEIMAGMNIRTIAEISQVRDADRQICIKALETVIQKLMDEGQQRGTIIAALAYSSVSVITLDEQSEMQA
jgi:hypothetical protein